MDGPQPEHSPRKNKPYSELSRDFQCAQHPATHQRQRNIHPPDWERAGHCRLQGNDYRYPFVITSYVVQGSPQI